MIARLTAIGLILTGTALAHLDAAAIRVRAREGWGQDPDDAVKQALSFGDLDANLDGKVSPAELSAARQDFARKVKETRAAALDGLDSSDSGKLSTYEAQAGKGRWVSLWDRAIAIAIVANDDDQSGDLDDKEASHAVARLTDIVNRRNLRIPHAKGQATRDEVIAAFQEFIDGKRTIFSICDVDNDGELSQIEIGYAMEILIAISG